MTDIEPIIANHLTHDEASFAVGYLEQAIKNAVSEIRDITRIDTDDADPSYWRNLAANTANELQAAINNVRQLARAACRK